VVRRQQEGHGVEGDWQPANALEQGLVDAVRRQDQHAYLALLSGVPLLVLVRQDGTGRIVDWLTSTTDSQTFLLGYTSPEALATVAGGREAPYLTATIEDLAERWPDPRWWLAVNSGLPIEGLVSPAYLNSLVQAAPAASRVETEQVTEPGSTSPEVAEPAPVEPEPVAVPAASFAPANPVERDLLDASRRGDTDSYLRALLSTEVLVPMADGHGGEAGPGWRTVEAYGELSIAVFTSWERLSDRLGDVPFRTEESLVVIRDWPDPALALAVNPGTPVGATLPGPQVLELAEWAVGAGLIDVLDEETPTGATPEPPEATAPEPPPGPEPDPYADWLQKVLPHDHVTFYRQRRYHMVSGHVHRIRDVGRASPTELYRLLGLDGPGSGFGPNDPHVHVIRWPAHGDGRYGDQERPVAAGQVPQSRLAAVPLPHGATLCRVDRDAGVTVVASYDADHREWREETGGEPE
jgi:hypothetical protein